MNRRIIGSLTAWLLALVSLDLYFQKPPVSPLLPFMPKASDSTYQWWSEGFPRHLEDAPWLRVIQTGHFAFALNSETLEIPHFGAIDSDRERVRPAQLDDSLWKSLPPAELTLQLEVDGKKYTHAGGGEWTRHGGPRLIESGRFFQRSDVTGIPFVADDGSRLNVEARFETSAWSERLGLVFGARPGKQNLKSGEESFGRVGGGFGLDGTNFFEIPHSPATDPEKFTLEFWSFVPMDFASATELIPWLVCRDRNEYSEGNYGITMHGDKPGARINIGGGRENAVTLVSPFPVKKEQWNHFVVSYDSNTVRFYLNNRLAGEKTIGKERVPGTGALAFGRRQDGTGDGYHFRGLVDEIRIYPRALTPPEVSFRYHHPEKEFKAAPALISKSFREEGRESRVRPQEQWQKASMHLSFQTGETTLENSREITQAEQWDRNWEEVGVSMAPGSKGPTHQPPIDISASDRKSGTTLPVEYDSTRSWFSFDLDKVAVFTVEGDDPASRNNSLERISLKLENPTDKPTTARLLFRKGTEGLRNRPGFPITGMSAILRDREGNPTGIPVQLSKNWHRSDEAGLYSGTWFHGFSKIHLPARSQLQLELSIAYAHWGGLPAASHSQLSLIGWGTNQLWEQSALGSWGESICYEPEQIQGRSMVTDVRPMMVNSIRDGGKWAWTCNVGGADFFRLYDPAGNWIPHSRMKANYHRYGPCLTEVTYQGKIGTGINRKTSVSLARTDDIVRGTYRVRLDVNEPTDFSRFVIFQVGADTYNSTREKKMAIGNESGLIREWETRWGGDVYQTEPAEAGGTIPWVSLHDSVGKANADNNGAWANRGFIIRSWNARLGGKAASPWVAERGISKGPSSIVDILPPPGVGQLKRGDFVEATIEHIIMPQYASDYYGPNEPLTEALKKHGNTWNMIHREAVGNDFRITVERGTLMRPRPSILLKADRDQAAFTLSGGLAFVPVTIAGISRPEEATLLIDGKPLDQSVHGNDFWQTDYDPKSRTWSLTFNIPASPGRESRIRFRN